MTAFFAKCDRHSFHGAKAETCLKWARQALEKGDFARAEATARAAAAAAATSAEAHHLLARSLRQQGRLDEAVDACMAAIKLAPAYAEAQHSLAQCRLAQGEMDAAIAAAHAAIALAPHYAEAHFTLGTTFYRSRRLPEAKAAYRAALSVKPDYVEAMNYLALVLQDEGRLPEAETLLRQATALRPDYADAHNNLGFVLRQLGRPAEAAASFKVAHDLFEPHLVLHPTESGIAQALDTAMRFVRIAGDLAQWNVTGTHRSGAWTDYRQLHQATNGTAGDVLSSFLKRVPGHSKELPAWRDSPIFPWIRPADLPRILESLDRDGLYVFDRLIAPELLDEMLAYARTTEADLYPPPASGKRRAVFDPVQPLASGYQFDEARMLEQPVFQRIIGDPLLLAISQAYLGVEPRLAFLAMWWSAVFTRNPIADMAQLFHADLAHLKWLKTFVYLTDVTAGTGPHSFVKGSHKADDAGRELRRRGLVRISDEDIIKAYGSDRVVDLVGPRGTVFIADTRGFHKGHLPRTGPRLLLQVYQVNSLYPDMTGHAKRYLAPKDPVLIETIRRHPKMFAGYQVEDRK